MYVKTEEFLLRNYFNCVFQTLQQEVHSLRNRLQVAEKIQAEYQSDLDCQQQQINDANEMASALSLKLKEEHTIIVKELEEKVCGPP